MVGRQMHPVNVRVQSKVLGGQKGGRRERRNGGKAGREGRGREGKRGGSV